MGVTNGKGCFRVVVSAGSIPRVTSILSALLTGAEARGWAVVTAGKGLGLSPEGEDIGFELVELTDRQPHSITSAEAAAQAKWESRVQAAKRTGAYISTWDAPRIPEWDYTPNGKLSFKLDQHVLHRDIRRTFSDRKSQTVEDLVPSILDALEAHARAEQAFRLEQEQRRIESEERERLWALERKRHELELRRIEFLDRQLERCSRIQRTEALLAALGDGEMPAEAIRFADWARGYLAILQAELEPSAIAAKLAITGLMNEEAHVPQWIDVETGQYSPSR